MISTGTAVVRDGQTSSPKMIPAFSDDTVEKLRDLHPERSLNLNLETLPMPESLNSFWDGEEGRVLRNTSFRVTKVRKYFRNCQSLDATDINGWRGREHVLNLFTNNDTELHWLIIDYLIFLQYDVESDNDGGGSRAQPAKVCVRC